MSCWNLIGMFGDQSCAELSVQGHCRDCPTYRAAAARLLDSPLSDEQLADATTHLAKKKPPASPHCKTVVIFRAGTAWLALLGIAIQEIVTPRPIHSVPHRRNGVVLGLANVRGELLPCIALPVMLNLAEAVEPRNASEASATARLLVARQEGGRIGYPVEEVFGIVRFHPEDSAPAPSLVVGAAISFTTAVLSWRGHPVSLLDEQSLLAAANRSLASATAI